MFKATDAIMEGRHTSCDSCMMQGVLVDTDAGEIVKNGTPYQVQPGHVLLRTYDEEGDFPRASILCEACADQVPTARKIFDAADAEGMLHPQDIQDANLFTGKPQLQGTQQISSALRRAGIKQDVVDFVAMERGWPHAPSV